jgi:hypothetical protein
VEPFARTIDLGERKSPSSASDLLKFHRYVEDLNDARTTLTGFFSIR